MLQRILICLFVGKIIVLASSQVAIVCEDSCHANEASTAACCVTVNPTTPLATGIPPPKPKSLKVNWYIHRRGNEAVIALNITWIDLKNVTFGKYSKGYLLDIVRGGSIAPDAITCYISKQRRNIWKNNLTEVSIMYTTYGTSSESWIDPGYNYYVSLKSLPLPEDDKRIIQELSANVEDIPDCHNNVVKSTKNCVQKEEPPTFEEPAQPTVSSSPSNEISTSTVPTQFNQFHIGIGAAGGIILLLLSLISLHRCLGNRRSSKGSVVRDANVLVVLRAREANSVSLYSEAGDLLCQFLRKAGADVVYTLWKTTEMENANPWEWVRKQVDASDHIIIIYSPIKEIESGAEFLINPGYDPYNIVYNISRNDNSRKYCVVHFERFFPNLDSLPCVKTFQLPENIHKLCCEIGVVASQASQFKQKLAHLVKKMRLSV